MSMTSPDQPPCDTRTPYADAAPTYWQAGWHGVLPLPHHAKKHPPKGYTGATGEWPSYPDVYAWTEDHADGNIALRLPPNVIGIDVDHYGNKPGGLVLAEHERNLGPLPATWRTTSRDDGTSGIRLYKIPAGLRWPGILGPGIETIRHEHRYAVVWPSVHPDTGGTYRWINPDGLVALGEIPTIDDLPDLPDAWIAHFTGGELAAEHARADLTDPAAHEWVTERGTGPLCRHTDHALARGLSDITAGGSRHDATLALTNRLIWLAGEGHTGATTALSQARHAFLAATAGDRTQGEAEAEWDRMIVGAVRMSAAAHPTPQPDPCTDPFHGLIPRKDQPCPTPNTTPAPATSPTAQASTKIGTASNAPAAPAEALDSNTATNASPTERTSWWPVDLTDALAGIAEPPPAHLTRDDGHSAFYPGRVNGIIGPSESGKTWIAMHDAHQTITRGGHVTVLDFEDSAPGVIGRLLALGLHPDQIRDHIAYIGPQQRYNQLLPAGEDLAEHLATWRPDLIILDGFNAAMAVQGLNLLDNTEATMFFQELLRPLAASGATVVYVDHTPKDKENTSAGGIGAQAKRAMTSGCTLKVDVVKAFGKGQSGKLRLYVDKDRQGDVRGTSAPSKTGHWFGDFNVTGHADGTLDVAVHAPDGFDADHSDTFEWRPTGYMERVSAWLQDNPRAGRNEIVTGVSGKAEHVKAALKVLIGEGWVDVERDGRKHLHTIAKPYSEAADLAGDTPTRDRGPNGVPMGSGTPVNDWSGPRSHGVTKDPMDPGPQSYAGTDPDEVPANEVPDETFCKSCGTDITEDLKFAPSLFTCRHCRKPINGSAR